MSAVLELVAAVVVGLTLLFASVGVLVIWSVAAPGSHRASETATGPRVECPTCDSIGTVNVDDGTARCPYGHRWDPYGGAE